AAECKPQLASHSWLRVLKENGLYSYGTGITHAPTALKLFRMAQDEHTLAIQVLSLAAYGPPGRDTTIVAPSSSALLRSMRSLTCFLLSECGGGPLGPHSMLESALMPHFHAVNNSCKSLTHQLVDGVVLLAAPCPSSSQLAIHLDTRALEQEAKQAAVCWRAPLHVWHCRWTAGWGAAAAYGPPGRDTTIVAPSLSALLRSMRSLTCFLLSECGGGPLGPHSMLESALLPLLAASAGPDFHALNNSCKSLTHRLADGVVLLAAPCPTSEQLAIHLDTRALQQEAKQA
ncbi:hypothetical protein HaLaN_15348, partial [Haematococcus lacustris]